MKHFIVISLIVLLSLSLINAGEYPAVDTASSKLSLKEARAILFKSLILPGWGEHSIDHHTRAYVMNGTELGLWVSYALFHLSGRSLERDMKAYAAVHAGINPAGKDLFYFTDMGNYMNLYEYNDQKLRNRQSIYLYPDDEEYFWAWDSDDARREFDEQRIRSQELLQMATFALGGLVLNRIVSVIDIIILTKDRVDRPFEDVQSYFIPGPGLQTLTIQFNLR